jgi:hypothetical protein
MTGISIALVTMLTFVLPLSGGFAFAMGAHGGPLSPPGETKAVGEGPARGEKEPGKGGEGTRQEEKTKEQAVPPSPEKKPRIKYRDMYECGC